MSDFPSLGAYLKDRRMRLDPVALGYKASRRRTPGLRREEVAQRANISPTWYTWLEQGRGGAPSAQVLERIAAALMLTNVEREHIFILALGHGPEIRHQQSSDVTPRLQNVLDALESSPALIRTASWDVIAWNRAAAAVFVDYGKLDARDRNILRLVFLNSTVRDRQVNWGSVARYVVAVFRADVARAGLTKLIQPLVDELCEESAEFEMMWRSNDVLEFGEGVKRIRHPIAGKLELEYSAFAVDGRPDLSLLIYPPANVENLARIQSLMANLD